MKKIKWGVLGTASIAKGATIPGMKLAENCELYAIAGRNLEKAESFKEQFGFEKAYGSYEELLADPEVCAVYIPLPNHLHPVWCKKAIQAGKHVLCEKPLAPSEEVARELFAEAEKAGVVLMEAFAYLHSPYIAALKEIVDSGRLGAIDYIEAAFMGQVCKDGDIRLYREMYGGALYDLGCYCTSLMVWLLGDTPEKAQALAEFSPEGIDLFTAGYLQFPNNIRASFHCGMLLSKTPGSRKDHFYIHGARGYIRSDVEFNQAGELSYTLYMDGAETVKTIYAPHNYQLEVENLGRCILQGESPHVSPQFSLKNAKAMDMVLQAIKY